MAERVGLEILRICLVPVANPDVSNDATRDRTAVRVRLGPCVVERLVRPRQAVRPLVIVTRDGRIST